MLSGVTRKISLMAGSNFSYFLRPSLSPRPKDPSIPIKKSSWRKVFYFFRSGHLILLSVGVFGLHKFNPAQVKNKLCSRVLGTYWSDIRAVFEFERIEPGKVKTITAYRECRH